MPDEEYSEEDEATHYDEFSSLLTYRFNPERYDISTFDDRTYEKDETVSHELKLYYPELTSWPSRALATAWRHYSRDVGSVEEEYVCVRVPGFLAYLFVVQEGWMIEPEGWFSALDTAVKILWPSQHESDYSH